MSDVLTTAYLAAFESMRVSGPGRLHALAAIIGGDDLADGHGFLAYISGAGPDDPLRKKVAQLLADWDHQPTPTPWMNATEPHTSERRQLVMAALRVDDETAAALLTTFPIAPGGSAVVIAQDWEEWRTAARRTERDFYWSHYRNYLQAKGWSPNAIAGLDAATEEVVRRLSDPTREVAYRAKGLVVGYVQSGKTANFTGVAAKAIDAGYRLVIVLTGTTNMLRNQTQRRIDMELCGRENILLGISPNDPDGHDYRDDEAWLNGDFIIHGGRPSDNEQPDIWRLSTHDGDYRRLRQGISALEFVKRGDRRQPLFAPTNLFTSDARLVVAKKNAKVLKDLVTDLQRIASRLGEVPALIIDDESDQASVNTTSRAKWTADAVERSAINRWIAALLDAMPRAQYVGYTATPYANVFIDPNDAADIFPTDFIIALPRPDGYMGADDFHDQDDDVPVRERPLPQSKERAHVRELSKEPDPAELQKAMDMFVLTGAVKLHRQCLSQGRFRHHTMLVHEAMNREVHREAAEQLKSLWKRGGYYSTVGMARLRKLYEDDLLPVSRALAPELSTPDYFDDLLEDVAEAVQRIDPQDADGSPIIVVNSDKDLERHQESLDFDKRPIWRILVGGNKLARGFTVEGLTVTYYRRATGQVDTLMQMGRWFGFRPNYRDLVRLYTTPDLHELFAAASLDEEHLRSELRHYAGPIDGKPQLTPRQVPPLIAQHRPDLRPTGRNKMWNAELVEVRKPGGHMEPVAFASGEAAMARNTRSWLKLLTTHSQRSRFPLESSRNAGYDVDFVQVEHRRFLTTLAQIEWTIPRTFRPELRWLEGLSDKQISDWIVFVPFQTHMTRLRTIDGAGPYSIFKRIRTGGGTGALKVASEEKHRWAARRIAGVGDDEATSNLDGAPDGPTDAIATGDPVLENPAWPNLQALCRPRRGALILYPTSTLETDDLPAEALPAGEVTMAFHMVMPLSTRSEQSRQLILWRAIDAAHPNALLADVTD